MADSAQISDFKFQILLDKTVSVGILYSIMKSMQPVCSTLIALVGGLLILRQ
jgi:hypothetical protein